MKTMTGEGTSPALALRQCAPTVANAPSHSSDDAMRLADAIGRVDPTWVEAVAVVQAVCAQLGTGQAPPALGDIRISPSGAVSFPLGGVVDTDDAVQAVGRLLTGILRQGDCPLPVWDATDLAARSPMKIGSVAAFGAALSCLPPDQGPKELAIYVQTARRLAGTPGRRHAVAAFGLHGLSRRAMLVILSVALSGVGAGLSVGAVVATRTAAPPAAQATGAVVALQAANVVSPAR